MNLDRYFNRYVSDEFVNSIDVKFYTSFKSKMDIKECLS